LHIYITPAASSQYYPTTGLSVNAEKCNETCNYAVVTPIKNMSFIVPN